MAKSRKSSKLPVMEIAGVIAGSIAAGIVSKTLRNLLPTAPAAVQSVLPVALGVFLTTQKNDLIKGAGLGMVAAGSSNLVQALMPGAKIGEVDELFMGEADEIGLPADQSILALPADQSILAGLEDDGISAEEMAMMNGLDEIDE
jgi:hypothetical protein